MLLNCDLGESYGSWTMGMDSLVMPHIDQANIACGFHGGDPVTICNTLTLAASHGVAVGAHPAYPDLVGFGRRSMNLEQQEIIASVQYQVAAIDGLAACQGITLSYVKPHGALYNDMMKSATVRQAIMLAVATYHRRLTLVLQATPDWQAHIAEAKAHEISLSFEAFADRCYDDDGRLLARSKPGAVHNQTDMLEQVNTLVNHGTVRTVSGKELRVNADTLCVHGDNMDGVRAIEAIRALVPKG